MLAESLARLGMASSAANSPTIAASLCSRYPRAALRARTPALCAESSSGTSSIAAAASPATLAAARRILKGIIIALVGSLTTDNPSPVALPDQSAPGLSRTKGDGLHTHDAQPQERAKPADWLRLALPLIAL